MSETLTHKDLAALCGVSETTIKSYRRKFPTFIPVHTDGKPIRFKPEAGDICLCIRDCFTKGMSINETYKVLKGRFREISRKDLKKTGVRASGNEAGGESGLNGVSREYLDKFFETAGQMMHGMAQLATAQARADKRLEKVEKALGSFADAEARNEQMFTELLDHLRTTPPEGEAKVRARKIINVRGSGGTKSYTFEGQPGADAEDKNRQESVKPETEAWQPVEPEQAEQPEKEESAASAKGLPQPSETFMTTPIVIRNEQNEFLGLPGRVPLEGFVDAVMQEGKSTGLSLTSWERRDRSWVLTMQNASNDRHELFFGGTKTPRGNLVVLFWRLDVNGEETTPAFLQEFFRQIKDRIDG
ncbi:MerR family transcriptional regulator [Pseudodesulfovibrio senegalensis]|uniref:MerR family transcriptional regulator n=1 Tax=Pseudodesulfovibrio senegalensis TaxID=1721087 RepID=A0A6N6MXL1_9BACT|nr:MerR family transcriptional regulator [Pseudodesulfovibrio senegalensis]KAB1439092.1 MerR family transcriptional regulator [Pseudodesulfovibrio senegalensis]